MTEHRTGWIRDPADPATQLDFYLGAHQPRWLEHNPVPLMVSVPRLSRYRRRRTNAFPAVPGAAPGIDVPPTPGCRGPWTRAGSPNSRCTATGV